MACGIIDRKTYSDAEADDVQSDVLRRALNTPYASQREVVKKSKLRMKS
jgi:hypothetical protein